MQDILKLSLSEALNCLDSKEVSSVELTKACLERIEQTNPTLNSVLHVCGQKALQAAADADKARAANESKPLLGVPVLVKDNIITQDVPTTCASKILEGFVPPYDAFVVKKLKEAGAVILGKTNMDEFAMGSRSENSAFGAVKNAVDETRSAGGSSGGSASAVAAFQAYCALGSDTGGSIRQPAAYCGVVGLKPTYSAVSRNGLVAFASSLDQIGPITRTVKDAAIVMNVISGHDSGDSTSADRQYPDYTAYREDIKGMRIGIAKEFFADGLSCDVKERIDKAIEFYESKGAKTVDVSIGSFKAALATYYVLSSAEAATNLARYDGVKYGKRAEGKDYIDMYYNTRSEYLGSEVKRRIMMGNYVLSSGYYDAYYLKALKVRTLIKRDFDAAFEKCDALICPTAPTTAPKLFDNSESAAQVYLSDIYTVPVNIAGLPAVSLKCGSGKDGLPVGVQLIGKAFDETTLFALAHCLEKEGV